MVAPILKGGKTQKRKGGKGKRKGKGNPWTRRVTAYFSKERKNRPDMSFGDALKECAKNKDGGSNNNQDGDNKNKSSKNKQ